MTDNKRAEKDLSQLDKFKDAARELKCDDDEQHFDERVGKIVKVDKRSP